jgi:hypothetical protein
MRDTVCVTVCFSTNDTFTVNDTTATRATATRVQNMRLGDRQVAGRATLPVLLENAECGKRCVPSVAEGFETFGLGAINPG